MTLMQSGNLDTLRSGMRGEVCGPQDANYDEARSVWNAQIDRRRPPSRTAWTRGREAPRSAGPARGSAYGCVRARRRGGSAVWDGELMVNLAHCNGVQSTRMARTARVGGGALLGNWTPPPRNTGWPCRPAWSVTPASAGLTLGGDSAGCPATWGSPSTT